MEKNWDNKIKPKIGDYCYFCCWCDLDIIRTQEEIDEIIEQWDDGELPLFRCFDSLDEALSRMEYLMDDRELREVREKFSVSQQPAGQDKS